MSFRRSFTNYANRRYDMLVSVTLCFDFRDEDDAIEQRDKDRDYYRREYTDEVSVVTTSWKAS